jgi:hypothetical protein
MLQNIDSNPGTVLQENSHGAMIGNMRGDRECFQDQVWIFEGHVKTAVGKSAGKTVKLNSASWFSFIN